MWCFVSISPKLPEGAPPICEREEIKADSYREKQSLNLVHSSRTHKVVQLASNDASREASDAVVRKAEDGLPTRL